MGADSVFPPARLEVRHESDPAGQVRVSLAGEVDISSVGTLTHALAALPRTAPSLVVDLANVTFLDSTGIAALVIAHRRAVAAGQTLTVVNAQAGVRRVLDITGTLPTLAGRPTLLNDRLPDPGNRPR